MVLIALIAFICMRSVFAVRPSQSDFLFDTHSQIRNLPALDAESEDNKVATVGGAGASVPVDASTSLARGTSVAKNKSENHDTLGEITSKWQQWVLKMVTYKRVAQGPQCEPRKFLEGATDEESCMLYVLFSQVCSHRYFNFGVEKKGGRTGCFCIHDVEADCEHFDLTFSQTLYKIVSQKTDVNSPDIMHLSNRFEQAFPPEVRWVAAESLGRMTGLTKQHTQQVLKALLDHIFSGHEKNWRVSREVGHALGLIIQESSTEYAQVVEQLLLHAEDDRWQTRMSVGEGLAAIVALNRETSRVWCTKIIDAAEKLWNVEGLEQEYLELKGDTCGKHIVRAILPDVKLMKQLVKIAGVNALRRVAKFITASMRVIEVVLQSCGHLPKFKHFATLIAQLTVNAADHLQTVMCNKYLRVPDDDKLIDEIEIVLSHFHQNRPDGVGEVSMFLGNLALEKGWKEKKFMEQQRIVWYAEARFLNQVGVAVHVDVGRACAPPGIMLLFGPGNFLEAHRCLDPDVCKGERCVPFKEVYREMEQPSKGTADKETIVPDGFSDLGHGRCAVADQRGRPPSFDKSISTTSFQTCGEMCASIENCVAFDYGNGKHCSIRFASVQNMFESNNISTDWQIWHSGCRKECAPLVADGLHAGHCFSKAKYAVVANGSCDDHGLKPIMTRKICKKAASFFGLGRDVVRIWRNRDVLPEGCYWQGAEHGVFLAINKSLKGSGSDLVRKQICKMAAPTTVTMARLGIGNCSETNGSRTSSTYPCLCGNSTCHSYRDKCNAASRTCEIDACSVTDGSSVSSAYPCTCGNSTCYMYGEICSAAIGSCKACSMCESGTTFLPNAFLDNDVLSTAIRLGVSYGLDESVTCQDVQDQLIYKHRKCSRVPIILHERCCGKPMCANGYDPKSFGCGSCSEGFGRSADSPFNCIECTEINHGYFLGSSCLLPFAVYVLGLLSAQNTKTDFADVLKIFKSFSTVALMTSEMLQHEVDTWSSSVKQMLAMLTSTFEGAAGSHGGKSIECFLKDHVLKRNSKVHVDQLIAFGVALPLVILTISLLVAGVSACFQGRSSQQDLAHGSHLSQMGTSRSEGVHPQRKCQVVVVLVVFTDTYIPAIVHVLWSKVPCVHTQSDVAPTLAWQLTQACSYNHKSWVKFWSPLHVTCVLICCLVPLHWIYLIRSRTASTYAFLESAYKKGGLHRFWEVTVISRKILFQSLSTIMILNYSPQSLGHIMVLLIIIFLMLHMYIMPYPHTHLNAMETCSLASCLVATVLAGYSIDKEWGFNPEWRWMSAAIGMLLLSGMGFFLVIYLLLLMLSKACHRV